MCENAAHAVFRTRFLFAYTYQLKLANALYSLAHYAKGTPSQLYNINTIYCSDCLLAMNFKIYFTPFSGFFSSFPYGTCSLSVIKSYQTWKVGLPCSTRLSRPVYSYVTIQYSQPSPTRLSLALASFSKDLNKVSN